MKEVFVGIAADEGCLVRGLIVWIRFMDGKGGDCGGGGGCERRGDGGDDVGYDASKGRLGGFQPCGARESKYSVHPYSSSLRSIS